MFVPHYSQGKMKLQNRKLKRGSSPQLANSLEGQRYLVPKRSAWTANTIISSEELIHGQCKIAMPSHMMRHLHRWTPEHQPLRRTMRSWQRSLRRSTTSATGALISMAGMAATTTCSSSSTQSSNFIISSNTCSSTGSIQLAHRRSMSRAVRRRTRSSLVRSRRWTANGVWWKSRLWTMETPSMSSTGWGTATTTSATTATTIEHPVYFLIAFFELVTWLDLPFALFAILHIPCNKKKRKWRE